MEDTNTTTQPDAANAAPVRSYSQVLKVKADPDNITPDERKRALKSLAGAISHGLRSYGEVSVRCLSYKTIAKAVKAIAVARGYVAQTGHDLFTIPHWIDAKVDTEKGHMTGIGFYVFTNQTDTNNSKIYPEANKKLDVPQV